MPIDLPTCSEDGKEESKFYRNAEFIIFKESIREDYSKKERFGVCWNCKYFKYRRTRCGQECAYCDSDYEQSMMLNEKDPVEECSSWVDKFAMPLHTMWNMATLIECDKRQKAGFETT